MEIPHFELKDYLPVGKNRQLHEETIDQTTGKIPGIYILFSGGIPTPGWFGMVSCFGSQRYLLISDMWARVQIKAPTNHTIWLCLGINIQFPFF